MVALIRKCDSQSLLVAYNLSNRIQTVNPPEPARSHSSPVFPSVRKAGMKDGIIVTEAYGAVILNQ